MGSFTGDMLRLLASGGMKLGTELLSTAVAAPILARKAMNQEQLKEALKMSAVTPDEGMPALNQFIQQLGGKPLPSFMAKTGNVLGPSGEALAMTPRPGVEMTPEVKERFVRAPIATSELLGQKLSERPELLEAFLGYKSGTQMSASQAAQNEIAAMRAEVDRVAKEGNLALGQARLEATGLKTQNDILMQQMSLNEKIRQFNDLKTQRELTQEEKNQQALLQRVKEARDKALDPKMIKTEGGVVHADAANALIKELHSKYPNSFPELQEIPIGGADTSIFGGWFGQDIKPRIGGTLPRPGASTTAAPQAATTVDPRIEALKRKAQAGDAAAKKYLEQQGIGYK